MPEIKIRIGAAVDQSMRTVFKPLVQSAIDARKQIQKEFASISVGMRTGFTAGARTARAAFADTTKAGDDMSRELANQAKRRTRMAEQESRREYATTIRLANEAGRERIRILNANNRLELQSAKQLERDRLRAAERSQSAVSKFADRTSHRATRFLMPNMPIMSMAHRASHEVLRGMGIEADISSLVRRGVGIEQGAANLSNRGHIEGAEGANGLVVDPKALEAEARKAGAATAVNPEDILAAGREFVGLTGDLDLWRKIMPGVVAQTKALGGNQEEAARAAGEFAAHIGDVPDKVKAVLQLTHVAAGQGKIGGVDFSDFAKYAAKVAAPAAMFHGDKTQNIGKLTAIAEIAKMHGGASSAAMAFGSIDSLVNTLRKPARLKSIKGLLGNENGQFTDSTHSELMDPHELIKQLIVASSKDKSGKSGKSDIGRVAAAVGDARSMKAIAGLQMTFNEAGGGQAGLDAMNAELKKFSGAVMSDAEVSRGLAAALETTESKAERFNQKLEAITHGAMAKLAPALEQLEGPALKLAGHLGDLASWVASNPGDALVSAVALVIGRAGLESAFRHGIETIIKNAAGTSALPGKSGAGMVGASGGLVGLFTSGVVIAALAYAIEEAGEAAIAHFFNKRAEAQNADATQTGNDGAALANATVRARKGEYSPEDKEALEKAIAHTKAVVERETTNVAVAADPMGGGFGQDDSTSLADSKEVTAMRADLAKMTALLADMLSGKLKVHVTNMPPPEQPKAPVAG